MPNKLTPEEVVTLKILKSKWQPSRKIAKTLGVTEGKVRYHLRRAAQGGRDGRKDRPFKAEQLAAVLEHFVADHENRHLGAGSSRPINVRALYDFLSETYEYEGSYRSVLRFVRARFPRPRVRAFRRVETPAGAQAQVGWNDVPAVDVGRDPELLRLFVMTLSFSRKTAAVWCRRMDQLHWQHAHNEAFRRLGGIPAVLRIDNLKTGLNGVLATSERSQAHQV